MSHRLNQLGRRLGVQADDSYRNANGVYMKLMNFRRFDPLYQSQGKSGLTAGGKTEAEVWAEFAGNPLELRKAADTIIALLDAGEDVAVLGYDEEEHEASEGKLVTRVHLSRERSVGLVKKKKEQAMCKLGRLACEACDFDFKVRYGKRGSGFIECHHTKPVSELRHTQKTKLSDLALLCSNCHRMIHSRRPWLTVDELKALLQPQ